VTDEAKGELRRGGRSEPAVPPPRTEFSEERIDTRHDDFGENAPPDLGPSSRIEDSMSPKLTM